MDSTEIQLIIRDHSVKLHAFHRFYLSFGSKALVMILDHVGNNHDVMTTFNTKAINLEDKYGLVISLIMRLGWILTLLLLGCLVILFHNSTLMKWTLRKYSN